MALFVNQESNRTELQKRLAAELAEKAKKKGQLIGETPPHDLDDTHYLKGTKQTTSLAWLWILIIVLFFAALIFLAMHA